MSYLSDVHYLKQKGYCSLYSQACIDTSSSFLLPVTCWTWRKTPPSASSVGWWWTSLLLSIHLPLSCCVCFSDRVFCSQNALYQPSGEKERMVDDLNSRWYFSTYIQQACQEIMNVGSWLKATVHLYCSQNMTDGMHHCLLQLLFLEKLLSQWHLPHSFSPKWLQTGPCLLILMCCMLNLMLIVDVWSLSRMSHCPFSVRCPWE